MPSHQQRSADASTLLPLELTCSFTWLALAFSLSHQLLSFHLFYSHFLSFTFVSLRSHHYLLLSFDSNHPSSFCSISLDAMPQRYIEITMNEKRACVGAVEEKIIGGGGAFCHVLKAFMLLWWENEGSLIIFVQLSEFPFLGKLFEFQTF